MKKFVSYLNQLKTQLCNKKAFTLVEMVIVLFIIALLLLIIIPNMSKQKEVAEEKADAAIIKTVETQKALYELEYDQAPTDQELIEKQYLTSEQLERYHKNK